MGQFPDPGNAEGTTTRVCKAFIAPDHALRQSGLHTIGIDLEFSEASA